MLVLGLALLAGAFAFRFYGPNYGIYRLFIWCLYMGGFVLVSKSLLRSRSQLARYAAWPAMVAIALLPWLISWWRHR